MRRLAHRVVDLVLDHAASVGEGPPIRTGDPADLTAALGAPFAEAPGDPDAAIDALAHVAFAHMQQVTHPRFFARIPSPAAFAGILGDWLATGFNAIGASWVGGSGPTTLELHVIEWLRRELGLPDGTEGIFLSGGSQASLTGLAAARLERGPGAVYLSDQAHASIRRALRALAFDRVRVLPTDPHGRLEVRTVQEAVARDRAGGVRPGFLVATAGTTNTGTVDPLEALADLAATEGLWLHVDGAHGAAAALCPAGRAQLAGLGRADSLVLDPHKWLFQPYDAGVLLVREPGVLTRSFAMHPEYLADVVAQSGEVDLRDRSLELTRRARAAKLWLTLRIHGAGALREAIAHGIELAEHVQARIEADPGWELVTPAQLAIVTFRRRGAGDEAHRRRAAEITAAGWAAVSPTTLGGRTVYRLVTIHPQTRVDELDRLLSELRAVG